MCWRGGQGACLFPPAAGEEGGEGEEGEGGRLRFGGEVEGEAAAFGIGEAGGGEGGVTVGDGVGAGKLLVREIDGGGGGDEGDGGAEGESRKGGRGGEVERDIDEIQREGEVEDGVARFGGEVEGEGVHVVHAADGDARAVEVDVVARQVVARGAVEAGDGDVLRVGVAHAVYGNFAALADEVDVVGEGGARGGA